LADQAGAVAGRLEQLRQRRLGAVDVVEDGDAVLVRVEAGQGCRPARRADRVGDEEVAEQHALAREPVDLRRLVDARAVGGDRVRRVVVGHDEDDVRACGGGGGGGRGEREREDHFGSTSVTWPTNASGSPSLTGGVPTTYSTSPAKGARTSCSRLPNGSLTRPSKVPVATLCIFSTAGCQTPVAGEVTTSERSTNSGLSTLTDGASSMPSSAITENAPASCARTDGSSVRPMPPDSTVIAGLPRR